MLCFTKMIIKNHIKRSVAIVLGITCSIAMMFTLLQLGDSILARYRKIITEAAVFDFSIGRLTIEEAEQLKEKMLSLDIQDIQIACRVKEEYFTIENLNTIRFVCYGVEEDAFDMEGENAAGFRLLEGRSPVGSDEVCIEEYVSKRLNADVGNQIVIASENGERRSTVTISGILENTKTLYESELNFGTMLFSLDYFRNNLKNDYLLIITVMEDKPSAEKITEIYNECQKIYAGMYGVDYEGALERRLRGEDLSNRELEILLTVGEIFSFNSQKSEAYHLFEQNSLVGNILRGLTGFILIAMVLLIFNSIHLTIAENTRELGMLRCIGMDLKQTALLIFIENGCYVLAGYLLGILAGNMISGLFGNFILQILLDDKILVCQHPYTYLVTLGIAVAALLLAFAFSIKNMLGLTPMEACRYTGIADKYRPSKMVMEQWSVWGFAFRNISREKVKSAIVIVTMTFSMVILFVIINTMLSIKLPQKDRKSTFSDYEVSVTLNNLMNRSNEETGFTRKQMEEMADIAGIDKIYALSYQLYDRDTYMLNRGGKLIPNLVYNDNLFQWLIEKYGDNTVSYQETDAVLVIHPDFEQHADSLEKENMVNEAKENGCIYFETGCGRSGEIQVSQIITADYLPGQQGADDSSNSGLIDIMLILTQRGAEKVYDTFNYTDIMIAFEKDNITAGEKIEEMIQNNEFVVGGTYEIGMEPILRNSLSMLYVAGIIVTATFVTALLNMITIMKANLVLRKKEYAILRALGMPLSRLKQTVRIEVLGLLFIAYGSAVSISLPLQIYISMIQGEAHIYRILYGYAGGGMVLILLVYSCVMISLRFYSTEQIITDIREE